MPRHTLRVRPHGRSSLRRRPLGVERLERRALLTIDFAFATGVGGSANGLDSIEMTGSAADAAGNVYVSGSFVGTVDLDPSASPVGNTDILTSAGSFDAFVAKYSPSGSLIWARRAGSALDDRGLGVAIDNAGSAYATGLFTGTVSFGAGLTLTSPGADAFAWKLDTNGNPIWARGTVGSLVGGQPRANRGFGIAVDPAGTTVALTGHISSPTTFGSFTLTPAFTNTFDGFVARLDGGTGNFNQVRGLSAASGGLIFPSRIAIDGAGNVVSTGTFQGTIDFDPDAVATRNRTSTNATFDAYVVKLTAAGTHVFSKTFGGLFFDEGSDVTTDAAGNVYAIGRFVGTINVDPDAPAGRTLTGPNDQTSYYVVRYDAAGASVFATDLGARHPDTTGTSPIGVGRPGIGVDGANNVLAAVSFQGVATVGGANLTSAGGSDILIVRLNTNGGIVEATRAGGGGEDEVRDLNVSANGQIGLAGKFTGSSVFGNFALPNRGLVNALAARLVLTTTPTRPSVFGDYDNDGKTDLAVYRPPTAEWFILQSTAGPRAQAFGQANVDLPVPADYDGDGKTDLAVFRPTTAQWFILRSTAGPLAITFGAANGDVPIPADYDGDGKADLAVYRPSTSEFFILQSTAGPRAQPFGGANIDRPVPADYDGDNKADLAVYRRGTGQWFILQSTAGPRAQAFGGPNTDRPIPADYDGDNKADLAVFRLTTAEWFILQSTAGPRFQPFGGVNTDLPIPADFDGDNKADLAVFRAPTAQFFILQSTAGPRVQAFGQGGVDVPLMAPLAFRFTGSLGPGILSARGFSAQAAVSRPFAEPEFTAAEESSASTLASTPARLNLPQLGDRIDPVLAQALDELDVFGAGLKRSF